MVTGKYLYQCTTCNHQESVKESEAKDGRSCNKCGNHSVATAYGTDIKLIDEHYEIFLNAK